MATLDRWKPRSCGARSSRTPTAGCDSIRCSRAGTAAARRTFFKVFVAARERLAGQAFFDDEVNTEMFENEEPYREHFRKRKAFNDNDPFIDADHDGRVDGVFFAIERHDGGVLAAKAVLTVNEA